MFDIPIAAVVLFVAGLVLHNIADWFLQNEWQAANKAARRPPNPDRIRYLETQIEIAERKGRWNDRDRFVKLLVRDSKRAWWDRHPAAYVHSGIHFAIQLLVFPLWGAAIIGVTHFFIDMRTPLTKWKQIFRQTIDGPMGIHVAIWEDQIAHWVVLAIVALLVV